MKSKNTYIYKQEKKRFDFLYAQVTEGGQLLYPGRLLQRAAQKFTKTIALYYKERSITYAQLYERVCLFTNILQEKGVTPSDIVLLSFENSPEFFIAYFAIWQAGAVVAPLNTFLTDHELKHIITDASARFVVTTAEKVSQFKNVDNTCIVFTQHDMPESVGDLPQSYDIIERDRDNMCALLYTSGTTGLPKGVMLSGRNIIMSVVRSFSRLELHNNNERVFAVLPLFHVFAQSTCIWGSFFSGLSVILVQKIDRRAILKALAHKPTIFLGVPALYGLLCLLKTAPLDSVRLFVCGGDALPDRIRSAFGLIYQRKLCNGYGLTETSPVISVDVDDQTRPTSCVGRPLYGVACEIRDDSNRVVKQGSIGAVWVKSDMVMLGYYKLSDLTQQVIQNGWFATGDLAYCAHDGTLVITGRQKDLIIHKGLNIYPQEIENVIGLYSNVIRVGVVGHQDDAVGEHVIAYVQIRIDENTCELTLQSLCKQHLAPYKIPKRFICSTDPLPLTATGKIDKKKLRLQER